MWKKILKVCSELLVGAVVVGGAVYYYQVILASGGMVKKRAAVTPSVVAEVQKKVQFADVIEALGTGSAKEAVEITATVTAKVVEIKFEDGDRVKAGQLLVRLDDDKERAELGLLFINRLLRDRVGFGKTVDSRHFALLFIKVDFPAPFPPITEMKSPSSTWRSKPFKTWFSLTVPASNVL